jgi:DMSO/TMAO reductase YedYZ molybdopterin-dependent catalytic subunit
VLDPTAWRLRVHGLVERELKLSLTRAFACATPAA